MWEDCLIPQWKEIRTCYAAVHNRVVAPHVAHPNRHALAVIYCILNVALFCGKQLLPVSFDEDQPATERDVE